MANSVFLDRFGAFCITDDANAFQDGCPVVIEAQYIPNPLLATAVVPDKPIRITAERFVDQLFTAGSVLANMLHVLFCSCPRKLDVTVIPREDAAGAVKAVYELPLTGTATTNGKFELYAGEGRWNIAVNVVAGDTAATVAAAVVAAYAALPGFPYVVTAVGGTLVFTAKNGGTVGNYLTTTYNWRGWLDYAPAGIVVGALTRTTAGSVDPAPLDYASVLGTCCFSCYGLGIGDATLQENLRKYIDSRWDCERPQCFGHGYTFNSGTLGQVLATWDNQATLSSLAVGTNPLALPYMFVANQVALRCCQCERPELSMQGPDNGLLSCVKVPATCTTEWSEDEMDALIEKGFNVMVPVQGGRGGMTSLYVVNDTTRYIYDDQGRENYTWRDTNSRYLDADFARKWGQWVRKYNGYAIATRNTKLKIGTKATTISLIKADLIDALKREVGVTISEFDDVNKDVDVLTDEAVNGVCYGRPGVVHVRIRYQRLNRLVKFIGSAEPKMFDNCVR